MKFTLAAAALAGALAHPTFSSEEFERVGRADAAQPVTFTVALPARNADVLDRTLNVLADPDSPLYGQWLSEEQVNNMIAPLPEHREAARTFATATGAKCHDWPTALRCTASAAAVEKLLQTEISTYKHTARKGKLIHRIHPGTAVTVPKEMEGKFAFISGLVEFPTVKARMGRIQSPLGKDQAEARRLQIGAFDSAIVMEVLDDIYQLKEGREINAKATGGPIEFQDDASWLYSDVVTFAQQNSVSAFNVTNPVGPFSPSSPDTEATLDIQYFGGVADGSALSYWTETDWMYEWVQQLASTPTSQIPSVFSVSWGWSEAGQCTIDASGGACTSGNSQAYVNQTNVGFAAAAARGLSILVSSGDSGAHGRTDGGCSGTVTLPDFPTSSPYVTAVGATQLVNATAMAKPTTPYCQAGTAGGNIQCASAGVEIVASTATNALIVSGGGFSTVATRPIWQTAAVEKYLGSGAQLPGAGNFNPAGRAYPDVSALGHNYIIWITGSAEQVDGTSCSAPVWGGIVTALNSIRLNAGKSTLGFLNPFLYKLWANGVGFTDVTVGNNCCTEQGCVTGCTGFAATAGYDAVSGLGTPKFPELAKAVAALP